MSSDHFSWIGGRLAFLLVSFSVGSVGDGLNIFQGIYLVGLGWNEGSVGVALSLMGLTALIVQPFAGNLVDVTPVDRRLFLGTAALMTAFSASAILFVHEGNTDHVLIYATKIVEGVASSFIAPCLAALTLATFGPDHFDAVMASNILWGHVGTSIAAVLAGIVAYSLYPDIQFCFLVIGASALLAVFFTQFLPQGDQLMGRGFAGTVAMDEQGHMERIHQNNQQAVDSTTTKNTPPEAASYWDVFFDKKTLVVCLTGFFFHFANANVLLVLGELMSGDDDGGVRQSAIPLTAGAIVLAQLTMAITTWAGDRLTVRGTGRKPLFLAGLLTLPFRCALIIWWKDAGDAFLLSTQVLDGIGGGLFGLIHPFLVADITFGTGRFNVLMGLTASSFGLGATMSNLIGQLLVEKFGHVTSLTCSMWLSVVPILLFGGLMPETLGQRGLGASSRSGSNLEAAVDETGAYKAIV
ncbi:MFS-type transporter [Seminavis robusta]|uniref:MFS-type transporter n=1 Tax=Seminavis robusta TaxID=568900 RepID=A0A9N8EBT0_9STRA|nr:MFS-type transporter [Seminavis robusta]|eukprot:Sro778_g201210.1 MFS-type transporter (467) ;mRNA; r:37284-38935